MKTENKKPHDSGINVKKAFMLLVGAYFLQKSKKEFRGVHIFSKEPEACTVIRETLLATKKVAEWEHERDVTKPQSFPIVPFYMIADCGSESFNMPFPYKFTFEENPMGADELIEKFLAKNKTVSYRPATDFSKVTVTPFNVRVSKLLKMKQASFEEAWACISKGKCTLYFDNTWTKEDYTSIMTDEAVEALVEGSSFGSMFMSNYKKYYITAGFHAAPFKSLATQMTEAKDWIFLDPAVAKKLLPVDYNVKVAVMNPMAQDHKETMKYTPRYFVRTNAGEGIYFPEWWYHSVYTEPGVNIMTNWRMPATLINGFQTSPMIMKQKIVYFIQFGFKEYILPDWFVDWAVARAHDSQQETVHQMYDYRKSIFEANAGKRYL